MTQIQGKFSRMEVVSQSPLACFKNSVYDESYQTNMNDAIKMENIDIESMQRDQVSSRQKQNIFIYFINLLISFCLSFQNVFLVFTTDEHNKGIMSCCIMGCTIAVSILTTLSLTKDKYKIINLYLLLDNIFLVEVASAFGFIGFIMVLYNPGSIMQIITMLAFPVQIMFFVGNFRIMLFHVQWPRWKVILFKLVLLADAAAFFQMGAYYMSQNYQYTNGADPQLDGQVKDFVLLYIFGLFTLFCELYSKLCDIDETAELKYTYQLKQLCPQKKIMKIRHSLLALGQKNHQKSRFVNNKDQIQNRFVTAQVNYKQPAKQ